MQGIATARASVAFDVDHHFDAQQVSRKRSAVHAASCWRGWLARPDWPSRSGPRCSPRPARRLLARATSDLRAASPCVGQNDDGNSLMIWRSPSFCTRSASSIAFSVPGSSGSVSAGTAMRHYIMRRAAPASISGSLIYRAAIIQAAPALVSLALRELASNRVLPAAPTARLAIAASPHARPSELAVLEPLANRHTPLPSQ